MPLADQCEPCMDQLKKGLALLSNETLQACLTANKVKFEVTEPKEVLENLCIDQITNLGVSDLVARFEPKCFSTFTKALGVDSNQPAKLQSAISAKFPTALERCNYSLRTQLARYLDIDEKSVPAIAVQVYVNGLDYFLCKIPPPMLSNLALELKLELNMAHYTFDELVEVVIDAVYPPYESTGISEGDDNDKDDERRRLANERRKRRLETEEALKEESEGQERKLLELQTKEKELKLVAKKDRDVEKQKMLAEKAKADKERKARNLQKEKERLERDRQREEEQAAELARQEEVAESKRLEKEKADRERERIDNERRRLKDTDKSKPTTKEQVSSKAAAATVAAAGTASTTASTPARKTAPTPTPVPTGAVSSSAPSIPAAGAVRAPANTPSATTPAQQLQSLSTSKKAVPTKATVSSSSSTVTTIAPSVKAPISSSASKTPSASPMIMVPSPSIFPTTKAFESESGRGNIRPTVPISSDASSHLTSTTSAASTHPRSVSSSIPVVDPSSDPGSHSTSAKALHMSAVGTTASSTITPTTSASYNPSARPAPTPAIRSLRSSNTGQSSPVTVSAMVGAALSAAPAVSPTVNSCDIQPTGMNSVSTGTGYVLTSALKDSVNGRDVVTASTLRHRVAEQVLRRYGSKVALLELFKEKVRHLESLYRDKRTELDTLHRRNATVSDALRAKEAQIQARESDLDRRIQQLMLVTQGSLPAAPTSGVPTPPTGPATTGSTLSSNSSTPSASPTVSAPRSATATPVKSPPDDSTEDQTHGRGALVQDGSRGSKAQQQRRQQPPPTRAGASDSTAGVAAFPPPPATSNTISSSSSGMLSPTLSTLVHPPSSSPMISATSIPPKASRPGTATTAPAHTANHAMPNAASNTKPATPAVRSSTLPSTSGPPSTIQPPSTVVGSRDGLAGDPIVGGVTLPTSLPSQPASSSASTGRSSVSSARDLVSPFQSSMSDGDLDNTSAPHSILTSSALSSSSMPGNSLSSLGGAANHGPDADFLDGAALVASSSGASDELHDGMMGAFSFSDEGTLHSSLHGGSILSTTTPLGSGSSPVHRPGQSHRETNLSALGGLEILNGTRSTSHQGMWNGPLMTSGLSFLNAPLPQPPSDREDQMIHQSLKGLHGRFGDPSSSVNASGVVGQGANNTDRLSMDDRLGVGPGQDPLDHSSTDFTDEQIMQDMVQVMQDMGMGLGGDDDDSAVVSWGVNAPLLGPETTFQMSPAFEGYDDDAENAILAQLQGIFTKNMQVES